MEEEPPSILPRGQEILRPASCGCASVSYAQSTEELKSLPKAAGGAVLGFQSRPPASSKSTRVVPSADRRFARTQPAEPAPTTITSYMRSPDLYGSLLLSP